MIIRDIGELFSYLESEVTTTYYRGYHNYENEMRPSIGRNEDYLQYETQFLTKTAIIFSENENKLEEYKDAMESAQHYGFPTRLLDWTIDPFIALFFSLGDASKFDDSPTYMALYKHSSEIYDNLPEHFSTLGILDYFTIGEIDRLSIPQIDSFNLRHKIDDELSLIQNTAVFNRFFEEYVKIIPERIMFSYTITPQNTRKLFQKGLFTMHKNPRSPFPKESYMEIKLVFSVEDKKKISERLSTEKGINKKSVFEDKYGYADKIRKSFKRIINS